MYINTILQGVFWACTSDFPSPITFNPGGRLRGQNYGLIHFTPSYRHILGIVMAHQLYVHEHMLTYVAEQKLKAMFVHGLFS